MNATRRTRGASLAPAALAAALAFAGCATQGPYCQFAVSNVGEDDMREIVLTAADGLVYRTAALPPRTVASYRPTTATVGRNATLAWKTPNGTPVACRVALPRQVPEGFRGRIFYERDETNLVTAFVLDDPPPKASLLPWARPESWEGTVGIPGLTRGGDE